MSRNCTAHEQIVRYFRQEGELRSRILSGTIDPEDIRPYLQKIIEGKVGGKNDKTPTALRCSPATYLNAFAERNESHFKTFADKQLYRMGRQMMDHADPLMPITINFSLGKGFGADYDAITLWLTDVLADLTDEVGNPAPVKFVDNLKFGNWEAYAHSGTRSTDEAFVEPVYLDYSRYWNRKGSCSADEVWATGERLPLFEPIIDAALNPRYAVAMDGKNIPYIIAPGICVDSGLVARLCCESGEIRLGFSRSDYWWRVYAFVVYLAS